MDGGHIFPAARRLFKEIKTPSDLSRALWGFGEHVAERGKNAGRSASQCEDYCLRRYIVALEMSGKLLFPLTVTASKAGGEQGWPDFVLTMGDNGRPFGVEHTDAATKEEQAYWAAQSGEAEILNEDGFAGEQMRHLAASVERAVRRKGEKKYPHVEQCELLVFANSGGGFWENIDDLVVELRRIGKENADLVGLFSRISVIFRENVILDALRECSVRVDISSHYEIDFFRWSVAQARLLATGVWDKLDIENLAEEIGALGRSDRRALESHLRNLCMHWLKWDYQPNRRSKSWVRTIRNALLQIEAIVRDSPSLDPRNDGADANWTRIYEQAVDEAYGETKLSPGVLPKEPPFSLAEMLNRPAPDWGEVK